MKRTSWRAIPALRDRVLPSSNARARATVGEASARSVATLKATGEPGDSRGVHPSRAPRLRARARKALYGLTAIVAAAALAGCFSITSQTTAQEGDIGDVIVTTDMCLTSGAAGCSGGLTNTTNGNVQYLIAYLMPTWAQEPDAISWTGDEGNLTLGRNLPYENILQGFAPAPIGTHWIGYATNERPAPPTEKDERMRATARVGVPSGSPSDLQLATVTGWRTVRDSANGTRTPLSIDRPFNCAEQTNGEPTTTCILSGDPEQSTTPGQTPVLDDVQINTLTLGVPPTTPSVRAGGVAVLEFPLTTNYSGTGNDTIPMKVTTTLKGAKIEAAPNVILGANAGPSEVRVTVPLIAETGDYTVTLATANGIRSSTGTIHVTGIRSLIAAASAGQVKTLKEGATKLKTYLKTAKSSQMRRGNTFDLPIGLPAAGTVTGTLVSKGKTLSTAKSTLKIAGTVNLHLTPTSRALKQLRAGKALSGTLKLVFKPRSGKTQTASLRVKLK